MTEMIYQFKILLQGSKPPIWRRIQVPESYSFYDLHVAIQDSMGWLDCHLHHFHMNHPKTLGKKYIAIPDDAGWSDVDFLFFGKLGEVSTNNTVDQENTILSLQLLQVCLVYINTLMIQEVLKDPAWKDKFTSEDWRALTPLIHAHINPYGLFPLDMSKSLDIERSKIQPPENDNDLYQNAA